MARSLDRPMRYFLAKRQEGPALFVADRIDTLQRALEEAGLEKQFHPSYTRMVPAHYIVELALVGCPDPDPTYTRFFTPGRGTLPPDLDEIGRRYVGALAGEIAKWLAGIDRRAERAEPIGVSFSGGIDSGAVFLVTYHTMLRLGMAPARLKAFVLDLEWTRRGAGTRVSDPPDCRCSSRRLRAARTISTSSRPCASSKTTSHSTSSAPRWACCSAGNSRALPEWRHLADGDGATRT
jgi:asparagine synthase (glutamine-hydrolysing)